MSHDVGRHPGVRRADQDQPGGTGGGGGNPRDDRPVADLQRRLVRAAEPAARTAGVQHRVEPLQRRHRSRSAAE